MSVQNAHRGAATCFADFHRSLWAHAHYVCGTALRGSHHLRKPTQRLRAGLSCATASRLVPRDPIFGVDATAETVSQWR